MSGETIKIEGLRRFNSQLKRLDKTLPKAVRDINFASALIVAKAANTYVPVRTGRLAKSIRARATRTSALVTAGSGTVPYAGPIHFGWAKRNIKPQPFLYEALDSRRVEVITSYEKQINELVQHSFPGGGADV